MTDERAPTPPNPPAKAVHEGMIEVEVIDRSIKQAPDGSVIVSSTCYVKATNETFVVMLIGPPTSFASRYMAALRAVELSIGRDYDATILAGSFAAAPPAPSPGSFVMSGTGIKQ